MLLGTSCSKDSEFETDNLVAVTLDLLNGQTRTLPFIPGGYKLRYIVEVYNPDGQMYRRIADYNHTIQFSLVGGRSYDFLVWADYVRTDDTDANLSDHHYNTQNGLKSVEIKTNYSGSDHSRDAFCGKITGQLINSAFKLSVTLQRPFAKFEIYNTGTIAPPQSVAIRYHSKMRDSYNVATGVAGFIDPNSTTEPTYPNTYNDIIALDYLFVNQGQRESISVDITVGGTNKTNIIIPLEANKLTKITGSF